MSLIHFNSTKTVRWWPKLRLVSSRYTWTQALGPIRRSGRKLNSKWRQKISRLWRSVAGHRIFFSLKDLTGEKNRTIFDLESYVSDLSPVLEVQGNLQHTVFCLAGDNRKDKNTMYLVILESGLTVRFDIAPKLQGTRRFHPLINKHLF